MQSYEIEIDGQIYEVDASDLAKYQNPETGELSLDIFAQELKKGLSDEDKAAFNAANKALKETGEWITPGGSGAAIRTVASGAIPFSSEIEAGARSLLGSETYDEALESARKSRDDYAAAYPMKALGLQAAGALAPAVVSFGTATPLSAARAATMAGRIGRSAASGAGLGALYGFGNSRGGFSNRFDDAVFGALTGGAIGGVTPAVTSGIGVAGNKINTFMKGLGSNRLPVSQVEPFMLNNVLQNTNQAGKYADILAAGARQGADDISDAAFAINNLYREAQKLGNPALYRGETAGGTNIGKILSVAESPRYIQEQQAFQNFVGNNPSTTKGGIEAASRFMKRHPSTQKIMKSLKLDDVDPDTFSWWQNMEQGLTNSLPKKYNTFRLTGKNKKIFEALQDISAERERLFPGLQDTNVNMASGIAAQERATDVLGQRLNTIAQRPAQLENTGSGFMGLITNRLDPIMNKGRARYLIEKGAPYEGVSDKILQGSSITTDAILRALIER